MIALLLAAFMSITFISAVVFTLRQTAANRQHTKAMSIATYYQNLVMASDYFKIGETGLDSNDFEQQFHFDEDGNRITESNPLIVHADPDYPDESTAYQVWFEFTGYGTVSAASANSITATFNSLQEEWEANEWIGNYLTVTTGRGRGQIMYITSNTGTSLTATGDLTGTNTGVTFARIPPVDSQFVINNAKTIRIYVTWGDEEGHRQIVRQVQIRHLEEDT